MAQLGVVGLGVMGGNLALNVAHRGFSVAGWDADPERSSRLAASGGGRDLRAAASPEALVSGLERPRLLLLMVPAGRPVDEVVSRFAPLLDEGDVVVDGGNSHFLDTERRGRALDGEGIRFVGMGVSGGEEGARHGPSLMPGGPAEAWETLAPVLRAIAARAPDGEPCVAHVGPGGSGHFVKMVHNGIEYGDMQLIAEAYDVLRRGLGLTAPEVGALFAEWNGGELESYLVELTAAVLARVDAQTGRPLVDLVLDEAAQKGTGKWTSQAALDLGAPVPTIDAAVTGRLVSARKAERLAASRVLAGPPAPAAPEREALVSAAREALYASKVVAYAQGLGLLRAASEEYGWGLEPATIARIWRGGCIIRARLLSEIRAAFEREPGLTSLLLDGAFRDALAARQAGWRRFVRAAVALGIPAPAHAASLAYYDACRSERLPASLTQAQRDAFGAHTFRRVDQEGVFHADWLSRS